MSFERFNRSAGIKVTGLTESIRAVENIVRSWNNTCIQTVTETQDFFANEAKRVVHKVSHRLEANIKPETAGPGGGVVSAQTPYALKEEERKGVKLHGPGSGVNTEHPYMKPASEQTVKAMPGFIVKNFDALFSANKTTS